MKDTHSIRNRGLTLVELIIVVSIVAALALIGIAYFREQTFKGNDAKRKSDINRIKIAVEEYEKDHDCYPLAVSCNPGTGLEPYLSRIPCEPKSNASYYYEHQDSVCPGWYRVYTVLDSDNDSSLTPGIGPTSVFNFVESSPNAPSLSSDDSTPPPSGGGGGDDDPIEQTGFYGCKNSACEPISWNSDRPGPECDPNFQNSSCYNQCGSQAMACIPWH